MREEVELGGDILMLAGKKTINVRDIRVFKLYS